MEEAIQDSGRKNIKEELSMMEAQLTRWEQTAYEALSLRDKSKSLKVLLNKKVIDDVKSLTMEDEQSVEDDEKQEVVDSLSKAISRPISKAKLRVIMPLGQKSYEIDSSLIGFYQHHQQEGWNDDRPLSPCRTAVIYALMDDTSKFVKE